MSGGTCRFCRANGLLHDVSFHETEHFYLLMSIDPELPGSAMIIPHRHSQTPFDMSAAEWAGLPDAIAAARERLDELQPDGFTMGWNIGAAAGQTVGHTHLHLIARFADHPMAGRGIRHALKTPQNQP